MTAPQDIRPGEPAPHTSESPLVSSPPPVRARHLAEVRAEQGPFEPPLGSPAGEPGDRRVRAEATAVTGTTRDRLLRALLGNRRLALGTSARDRVLDWVGTVLVVALAAVTRLQNLGRPNTLVFDETYYVKDGFTLWRLGFEAQWPTEPNPAFEAGNVESFIEQAAFVVHPQVGKWLIGLGIDLGGGATSSGAWRLANAVVGIIAVLLIIRIARRLFASTPMGLVAGLLLAVDGAAIVHSRVALLDQFVMFFALLAFGCLVMDREWARRRLADRVAAILDAGPSGAGAAGTLLYGPRLGFRWWRLAAGVSLGLACGVKWSGIYFVAAFGLLTVLWDLTARRTAGIRRWWEDGIVADGLPAFAQIVPTALLVYVASWWSWFVTPGAWGRQWAAENPGEGITWLPEALRSFVRYHEQMWSFHTGLTTEHAYQSSPIGWIIQWRPTSFYWNPQGDTTATITSLGNPLLWWLAALAIVAVIVFGVKFRDWRALAVLSGTIAGWLPWVITYADTQRTVFTFYTIAFAPWVVLTLVYVGVVALEHTEGRPGQRRRAVAAITAVVAAILVVSAVFYPLWTAQEVPYEYWRQVMRLQNWI